MAFGTGDSGEGRNGAEPVYGPAYRAADRTPPKPAAGQVEPGVAFNGSLPPYTAPYPPYPSDVAETLPIPANAAAALAYLVVPAVFFLLLPPYRSQGALRFHSWQAIFYFLLMVAAREVEQVLVSMFPSFIAFLLSGLLLLLLFAGWLVAAVKALGGEQWMLPLVGRFAASTASTTSVRA